MTARRACAVPGCDTTVPDKLLMCPPCWRRVSPSTRSIVGARWRAWFSDLGNTDKAAAYQAAKRAAITEATAR